MLSRGEARACVRSMRAAVGGGEAGGWRGGGVGWPWGLMLPVQDSPVSDSYVHSCQCGNHLFGQLLLLWADAVPLTPLTQHLQQL